jgi:hypothetical protein
MAATPNRGQGLGGQFNPQDHGLQPGTPRQQAAAQQGYAPVAGPGQTWDIDEQGNGTKSEDEAAPSSDRDNGGTEGLQEGASPKHYAVGASPKHYAVPASNQPATEATVAAEVKRVVGVLRSGSLQAQREAADLIEKAVAQYKEGGELQLVTG